MVALVMTVIVWFLLKFNLYPTKDENIDHDMRNMSVRPSYIKVHRREWKINVTERNQQGSFPVLIFYSLSIKCSGKFNELVTRVCLILRFDAWKHSLLYIAESVQCVRDRLNKRERIFRNVRNFLFVTKFRTLLGFSQFLSSGCGCPFHGFFFDRSLKFSHASSAEAKDMWIILSAFLYTRMAASCNEYLYSTKHEEISRRLKEILKLGFSSCCTESNGHRMRWLG
jgi:hypothetical protein